MGEENLPYQRDWLSAVSGPVQISRTRLAISSLISTVASKSGHSIVLPINDDGSKSHIPGRAITPSSTPSRSSHASIEAFVKASKTQRGGEVPRLTIRSMKTDISSKNASYRIERP